MPAYSSGNRLTGRPEKVLMRIEHRRARSSFAQKPRPNLMI